MSLRSGAVRAGVRGFRAAAAALLLVVLPVGAAMAEPAPAPLTAMDTLELQRVAAYLNAIRTMTADFRQVAGNGGVSAGKMWVARPGRMRFEYDPPTPIVLLADSKSVYYWDKQLHETSKYPLRDTPAWFFLRDPIDFGADVIVTGFQHLGDNVRITVVERAHPDAGSLTLDFSEKPLALRQWTVVDQQGKITTVSLSNIRFGVPVDPNLFQYQYLFSGSNQ